ncbi:MAG: site-specific DNA-methyltransferase [Microbacteriaceae bacterium]|nr:site-specific DNA-methyltransferase [Microbacteriaceae bacterium]
MKFLKWDGRAGLGAAGNQGATYIPTESTLIQGDNMQVLPTLPSGFFDLIYIDPPFNTGITQKLTQMKVEKADDGHVGFKGERYKRTPLSQMQYQDSFDDFLGFITPRLEEAHRLLSDTGTLYVHLDWREVHYVKVLLDQIFGRESFLNEIIWAYDYGARSKRKWPSKHDTILVYVKDPKKYHFDSAEVDREPYMAPGLVTPEKAELGKLPTDVWWHTIVSPTGKEKTGYPTQKPLGVLRRVITASSKPGSWVLDFFAGSGTTGVAAHELGRNFVLIDQNPESISVITSRFQ